MSRLGWGLAAAGGVVVASSCILDDFDVDDAASVGGAGAASSSSAAGGTGGDSICPHRVWPTAPTDPPDGDALEFTVAIRSVQLGEDFDPRTGPTIGYDLDGVCSGQGEEDICSKPDFADASVLVDGPEGIDNNAARVFGEAGNFYPRLISSSAYTQGISDGEWSVLFRVRGYNGEPNDGQVELALYPSPGMHVDPCNPMDATPTWDGSDLWAVHAFAVEGGQGGGGQGGGGAGTCNQPPDGALAQPAYVDDKAYVRDGTLVASIPKTELALSGGALPASVTLVGGFITAQIVEEPEGYALRNGLLVGRWPADLILGELSKIVVDGGMPLCTDQALYQILKPELCKYVDIETTVGGPTQPCDAISLGIGFEADPAQIGSIYVSEGTPITCAPGTDPADDTCGR